MPATAQNAPKNAMQTGSEDTLTTMQAEHNERERIKRERTAATRELDQQRQACYQKLAVTPCLNDARDAHNEKTRDLKRQEVALNDAQRKRAAADRVSALDQRNSPEAQLKRAQDRGKALEATTRREESQATRQKSRESQQMAAASAPSEPATSKRADAKPPEPSRKIEPQPSVTSRPQSAPKVAPEQRAGQAAKMQKSRQQALEREKAAELRRAEAVQREAKRKKPAAAGLPIQD